MKLDLTLRYIDNRKGHEKNCCLLSIDYAVFISIVFFPDGANWIRVRLLYSSKTDCTSYLHTWT